MSSFLFLLKEKETKSSSEFDGDHSVRSRFPLTNSHLEEAFILEGFNSKTPLPAFTKHLKALNFSLNAFGCLMILQVKNEALEKSYKLSSWHST